MLNSSSNAARSRCEHLLRTSARPRTKPDESIRTNEHERADRCPLEPAHVTVLIIMLKTAVLFKFKYSSIVHSTVKHCLSQCDTYSLDTHASASPPVSFVYALPPCGGAITSLTPASNTVMLLPLKEKAENIYSDNDSNQFNSYNVEHAMGAQKKLTVINELLGALPRCPSSAILRQLHRRHDMLVEFVCHDLITDCIVSQCCTHIDADSRENVLLNEDAHNAVK